MQEPRGVSVQEEMEQLPSSCTLSAWWKAIVLNKRLSVCRTVETLQAEYPSALFVYLMTASSGTFPINQYHHFELGFENEKLGLRSSKRKPQLLCLAWHIGRTDVDGLDRSPWGQMALIKTSNCAGNEAAGGKMTAPPLWLHHLLAVIDSVRACYDSSFSSWSHCNLNQFVNMLAFQTGWVFSWICVWMV